MDNMTITNAQYLLVDGGEQHIKATIDGVEMQVPVATGNKEYDQIMRQVAAGDLTIADAD